MAGGSGRLETAYRHAVITYGAMAAGTVLYVVAVAVVSISHAPFEGFAGQMPGLRIALWMSAAFEAGLIGIVRQTLLGGARAGDAESQAHRLVLTSVITAALAEVPAILGLVLFMLSGIRADFYALFALSLVLLAIYFPKLEGWRQWVTEPALGC